MNDPSVHLAKIMQWVLAGDPFCHLRFNDGEVNGMFNLTPASATTSGEHTHFRDLGRALKETFINIAHEHKKNTIIGSYWHHEHTNQLWASTFRQFLTTNNLDQRIEWVSSDFWYSTELELENKVCDVVLPLIDVLRYQGVKHRIKVLLVGNHTISQARHCLGAEFLDIPKVNAWIDRDDILKNIEEEVKHFGKNVIIWCAGLPGKVWAWEIYKKYPETSHIDAGHFFDGIGGVRNRSWMKRDGAHKRYYDNIIIPYLKSFI